VQQVRFGERLRWAIHATPDLAIAAVPQLLLQPIVENAVEHGVASSLSGGSVAVQIRRDGGTLVVVVDDDGPGIGESPGRTGVGLSNTRERLRRLFGERGTLDVAPRAGGGTRVIIRIPHEEMRASA
jgi:sensor histidine kinase YesM